MQNIRGTPLGHRVRGMVWLVLFEVTPYLSSLENPTQWMFAIVSNLVDLETVNSA